MFGLGDCLQEELHPGKKASWDASVLCSSMVSRWTWRSERRSPQVCDLAARATAAATVPSVTTTVNVWRNPMAFPAAVPSQPTSGLSVMKVHIL